MGYNLHQATGLPFQAMESIYKKICLLGDFAVGKTSLVRRYVSGSFDDRYLSTIGVKISRKLLTKRNHQLNLIIWDLAGGEDFSGHDKNYLRGAAGALLVVDLSRPETFRVLVDYASLLLKLNPGAAMAVAANKVDLVGNMPAVASDLEMICRDLASPFLPTSAKTGENVEEIIDLLAERLIPEGSHD